MIIHVTDDISRIGIRLLSPQQKSYVADWRRVLLTIRPGQVDNPCGPNGSPWFLGGCWYGVPTGIDLANPPAPDFPAITVHACELNKDCELVYILPLEFRKLPHGRYTGMLHYNRSAPVPPKPLKRPKPMRHGWPPEAIPIPYWDLSPKMPPCSPDVGLPTMPHAPMCVVATFDIDYGQRCTHHIVDHLSVTCAKDWQDEDASF